MWLWNYNPLIIFERYINLKKFYVLDSQYNPQLLHDLSGLEDSGRDISFEKCTLD